MRLDLSKEFESGRLEDLRKTFERSTGDSRAEALFSAIRFCGNHQIPMPEWMENEFFRALWLLGR